ncbi:sensor histidine kinase [Dongshaea marina]|uniref:sensor histidine kinase n=1 Tax=Dongshaea marina TaxID=2047966 RepID=UPI0038992D83
MRTPITSLALTIDSFRQHFDALSPPLQKAFARLLADNQRLQQLAHCSQHYLSLNPGQLSQDPPVLLSDWLSQLCERLEIYFSLEQDRQIRFALFWVSLILDNLVQNARLHGAAPIRIHVTLNKQLKICVEDQGRLSETRLRKLAKLSSRNKGMGIGLYLVSRILKNIGGRLKIQSSPSRFTLECPYESVTAD